jgi:hypothetical protein
LFKVKSDVNLFEAYTEFWAEIMNSAFCSYYLIKHQNGDIEEQTSDNLKEFLLNFDFFINFERTYKFFQMVKTLEFMGLTYNDLVSDDFKSRTARETLYKENTNVLSYYIITTILLNNYQGFLSWCDEHNLSLLQFKKTSTNIKEFCNFIVKNYKTKTVIESVSCMQRFLNSIKESRFSKKNKKIRDYVLNNMRMTICELG